MVGKRLPILRDGHLALDVAEADGTGRLPAIVCLRGYCLYRRSPQRQECDAEDGLSC